MHKSSRFRSRTGLIFLAFLFIASTLPAAALQKRTVQNAVRRGALCNDGSPAVYYFRKGSEKGSGNWVIFLGGGGFCFSVVNCKERQNRMPQLMTAVGQPSTLDGRGIISDVTRENPDFANANQVVIPYCSSDLWSGNRPASLASGNFHFRGQRIFRAVIHDLLSKNSVPNFSSATRVLLAGTSAGGAGVMMHIDWLASQLPHASVRGLNDAGWIPEMDFRPLAAVTAGMMRNAIGLWNGKPDASCAKANAKSRYRCYLSSVFPFVKTPLMVQMSQEDVWVLSTVGVRYPYDPAEQFVADLFAESVRDSLGAVPAAFSPRSRTHGLLYSRAFHTRKIQGLSLRDVLGNWFFQRPGPVKAIQ